MEDSAGNWCLIESDPGVFSEMLKNFGVENVQVEEIYSLDAEQFRDLKPVYGLIFLFKWVKDENPQGSLVKDSRIQEMFFAKQVLVYFFFTLLYFYLQFVNFLHSGYHQRLCHSGHSFSSFEFGLSRGQVGQRLIKLS